MTPTSKVLLSCILVTMYVSTKFLASSSLLPLCPGSDSPIDRLTSTQK